jgi:hypothetical protein
MMRTLLVVSIATSACQEVPSLPAGSADASQWFDVSLPDASLPDGLLLTELGADGSATVVEPGTKCSEGAMDAGKPLDGGVSSDAGLPAGERPDAADGGAPASACTTPLAPGDLVFDEVMLATVAGSSDRGQWLEVRSTRACSVDLVGLSASAPHGATARTLEVTDDLWVPPFGFFLIADTTDPSENNGLPGLVLAWDGSPADVLHKTSDTITLSLGATTLDTLTYPDKKRALGVSMAFPADCDPRLRPDFSTWAPSMASWAPGLLGTPALPNVDVHCTAPTVPTCRATRR